MKEQKLKQIEDYIEEHENVALTTLCTEFDISMSTLRRALKVLCDRGVVHKQYGFVYASGKRKFVPFHVRNSLNTDAKKEACRCAAELIQENDIIYLDSGSTTCHILDYIGHIRNLTVITGNIDIIIKALALDNVTVFVLPGMLNKKNNSFSPADARQTFSAYNINRAFIAASGLSVAGGFSHSDPMERDTKLAAMEKSEQICFVLDDSKFDRTSLISLGPLTMADMICTNREPSPAIQQYCSDSHILLRYPRK